MGRPCDVTRHDDCQNLAQAAHERFGRIDILVNNAGIGYSMQDDALGAQDK